jgi:cytochrome c553
MKKIMALMAAGLLLAGSGAALAGDPVAGKAKTQVCIGCHGANGIANVGIYPNLAGQKEEYLVLSMKAYKNGERTNPIMMPMVANLSDEDIANIAAYYAGLSCK